MRSAHAEEARGYNPYYGTSEVKVLGEWCDACLELLHAAEQAKRYELDAARERGPQDAAG